MLPDAAGLDRVAFNQIRLIGITGKVLFENIFVEEIQNWKLKWRFELFRDKLNEIDWNQIRHFAAEFSKFIPLHKNCCIFVSTGPIDYKLALVELITWRRTGDRLLSECMLAWLSNSMYASPDLDELIFTMESSMQKLLESKPQSSWE